jgi:hypothetical protein
MAPEDVEPDADDDLYDPEDEDETTEASEGGTTTSSFGRTYHDLPDTHVTAGGFAKVLLSQRNVEVRPQVIYAMAKTSKTFPAIRHTDARIIVPIKEGLEWWDEKEKRVAGRANAPRNTAPTAFEKAQMADDTDDEE